MIASAAALLMAGASMAGVAPDAPATAQVEGCTTMSLTDEYFILQRDFATEGERPRFTGVVPRDEITGDLIYNSAPIRGRVLQFEMDEQALRREQNYPGVIGDFIVVGSMALLSPKARDIIAPHLPPDVELAPAVVENIDGTFIEPLYFLHIMEHRDVWDRQASTYLLDYDPQNDLGAALERIVLNDAALCPVPVEQRRIVGLAKVSTMPILFHVDLVRELEQAGALSGARLFSLREYTLGDELILPTDE